MPRLILSRNGGLMMEDQLPQIPGGPWGGLGLLGAALVSGFLWLRKFLSRDAVDRAADDASKSSIEMLNGLLADANARTERERERADKLATVLDAANQQISQLRQQVADLSGQVSSLQRQIAELAKGPQS